MEFLGKLAKHGIAGAPVVLGLLGWFGSLETLAMVATNFDNILYRIVYSSLTLFALLAASYVVGVLISHYGRRSLHRLRAELKAARRRLRGLP